MFENVLWVALVLFVLASLLRGGRAGFLLGSLGWFLFAVYWSDKPGYYLGIGDYFNVAATVGAAVFSVFMGYAMFRNGLARLRVDSLVMVTSATAAGGFTYFLFSEVSRLNAGLIGAVTNQTLWLLSLFEPSASLAGWNVISVNGRLVEIILACTAIQSMALFVGVIASVRASWKRMSLAFLVSVPVIYLLNLVRNAFVVAAYGEGWFGMPDESFYIAHSVIAKIGSTIALFLIAYAVLRILPEVVDMIDGVWRLFKMLRPPGRGETGGMEFRDGGDAG